MRDLPVSNRQDSTAIGLTEHGGNILRLQQQGAFSTDRPIDFSANINPCGPPAWLRSVINGELEKVVHYPDPDGCQLVSVIAEKYRLNPGNVVVANGTTELLHLLPHIFKSNRIIIPVPSYIDYYSVFNRYGFDIATPLLAEKDGFKLTAELLSPYLKGNDIVLFGNPVNPTGTMIRDHDIIQLAENHRQTIFIVDEAFHEFVSPYQTVAGHADNIITLNSLTKFFAVPGLRIGFGYFPSPWIELIKNRIPQWSVNTLAQQVALYALQDEEYAIFSRKCFKELKKELTERLEKIPGIKVYASTANYLLVKLPEIITGEALYQQMLKRNIIIRRCGNFQGLDDSFIRIAVRTAEENWFLVEHLTALLNPQKKEKCSTVKKAKSIMFQGTSSNAGKSVLTAALCRILLQDGLRIAPFKAQNMSLNSHVTREGREIGRAQAVQAVAAKVDADARMNPVLLKPNSNTGSQIIVNGKPIGNMDVRQYHAYKDEAWQQVRRSYDALAAEYQVIVLEGAGSPGEINLKKHDIVNMKMARYAEAPVLLVGDIDRGGVYASFAGIMDVIEEWERNLIAGFIVNKFRGDQSLLADAHQFIRRHTGRDVLGVIPYFSEISVPQEDSVALHDGVYREKAVAEEQVDIVVIELPRISNYTDIDALYYEPDVRLRFVDHGDKIGKADAVIIPGSKNVVEDLDFLDRRGFSKLLPQYAAEGGVIVGICGGYQMLGKELKDPHGIETNLGSRSGLGLIDMNTVLHPDKTLVRKEGVHVPSGKSVSGYEIHHGISENQDEPILRFADGSACGTMACDGRVWGAYLHGIFDADQFRRWFLDQLRVARGLSAVGNVLAPFDLEQSLDDLADHVRSCLDMEKIYQLIGV